MIIAYAYPYAYPIIGRNILTHILIPLHVPLFVFNSLTVLRSKRSFFKKSLCNVIRYAIQECRISRSERSNKTSRKEVITCFQVIFAMQQRE